MFLLLCIILHTKKEERKKIQCTFKFGENISEYIYPRDIQNDVFTIHLFQFSLILDPILFWLLINTNLDYIFVIIWCFLSISILHVSPYDAMVLGLVQYKGAVNIAECRILLYFMSSSTDLNATLFGSM